jgi:LmbE family N-acetylglucosaminyl deacetylase/ActR/RegA family two-component response regulator
MNILVVDDARDMRLTFKKLLENLGHEVDIAVDGEEAWHKLQESNYQVILCDWLMPELDGLALCERIRSSSFQHYIYFILLTSMTGKQNMISGIEAGVDDFVTKPIDIHELESRLKSAKRVLKLEETLSQNTSNDDPSPDRRKNKRVVLSIGAHPDDIEIGCGGTMMMRSQAGDDCHILILTNGEVGGEQTIRKDEAYEAAAVLGATLHFGNLVDTFVSEGAETISLIEKYIKELKPDTVYTHSTHDLHQDHRNCSKATMVAARNVREVLCYQSPSTKTSFNPVRFININNYIDEKIQAIDCFSSQKDIRPYLTDSMIKSTAEYWGRFSNYNLVEPFEVARF